MGRLPLWELSSCRASKSHSHDALNIRFLGKLTTQRADAAALPYVLFLPPTERRRSHSEKSLPSLIWCPLDCFSIVCDHVFIPQALPKWSPPISSSHRHCSSIFCIKQRVSWKQETLFSRLYHRFTVEHVCIDRVHVQCLCVCDKAVIWFVICYCGGQNGLLSSIYSTWTQKILKPAQFYPNREAFFSFCHWFCHKICTICIQYTKLYHMSLFSHCFNQVERSWLIWACYLFKRWQAMSGA